MSDEPTPRGTGSTRNFPRERMPRRGSRSASSAPCASAASRRQPGAWCASLQPLRGIDPATIVLMVGAIRLVCTGRENEVIRSAETPSDEVHHAVEGGSCTCAHRSAPAPALQQAPRSRRSRITRANEERGRSCSKPANEGRRPESKASKRLEDAAKKCRQRRAHQGVQPPAPRLSPRCDGGNRAAAPGEPVCAFPPGRRRFVRSA
jgi:hypothetical protein